MVVFANVSLGFLILLFLQICGVVGKIFDWEFVGFVGGEDFWSRAGDGVSVWVSYHYAKISFILIC